MYSDNYQAEPNDVLMQLFAHNVLKEPLNCSASHGSFLALLPSRAWPRNDMTISPDESENFTRVMEILGRFLKPLACTKKHQPSTHEMPETLVKAHIGWL